MHKAVCRPSCVVVGLPVVDTAAADSACAACRTISVPYLQLNRHHTLRLDLSCVIIRQVFGTYSILSLAQAVRIGRGLPLPLLCLTSAR